jgi:hypothetical protein
LAIEPLDVDEVLWRRVPPGRLKLSGSPPSVDPTGDAFRVKGTDDGVSVERKYIHGLNGRGPEVMLEDDSCNELWGVLEIAVAVCRSLGFDVIADRGPTDPHALIVPPPSSGKSKRLTQNAKWVIRPPRSAIEGTQ